MTTATTFTLPWPPSVNGMYENNRRNGRSYGKRLSAKAKLFRELASIAIHQQRVPKFSGQVRVECLLHAPTGGKFDADNMLKAVMDSLVHSQRIADDSRHTVRSLSVEWGDDDPPRGSVEVEVKTI